MATRYQPLATCHFHFLTLLNRRLPYFGGKSSNMKKLFLAATLLAAIATTSVSAQGGPGGMTPEQRAERMKQQKTDLIAKAKITDAEADKVMQIQQESRRGMMQGWRDMSQEDRQKKMAEIKAENSKKFKAIPLTDDQVKAVDEFYDEQMKRMMNRQGGGAGGNQ